MKAIFCRSTSVLPTQAARRAADQQRLACRVGDSTWCVVGWDGFRGLIIHHSNADKVGFIEAAFGPKTAGIVKTCQQLG